jgi:hypothetical protein
MTVATVTSDRGCDIDNCDTSNNRDSDSLTE